MEDIHSRLLDLVQQERKISNEILSHLAEVNERALYLKMGHDSLLKYCVRELKYSEAAAYRRIRAMKLIKEVAGTEDKLLAQKLNITQLCKAHNIFEEARKEDNRYIKPKRKLQLLTLIENKSTFESENILRAELKLPEKRRVIRVEVDEDVYQEWIRLKGRLAHKNLTSHGVLAYAINSATKEITGQFASSNRRSKAQPLRKNHRYIPIRLRQKLLRKANFKCSYPKCDSAYALEVDHIKPIKLGGKTTEDNLRVLCRNHNRYMNEVSA